MKDERSTSGSGIAKAGAILLVVLLVASFAAWLFWPEASDTSRIETEHGIQLPSSARDAQAMGDASNPILRASGLDRGASSIVVIDRSELPELLEQFPQLTEGTSELGGSLSIAPGNSIYQPSSVPWTPDQPAETTFSTTQPPSGGDFTDIGIYTLDDPGAVAVWIYTDWN